MTSIPGCPNCSAAVTTVRSGCSHALAESIAKLPSIAPIAQICFLGSSGRGE
jgi:hypothetical protein